MVAIARFLSWVPFVWMLCFSPCCAWGQEVPDAANAPSAVKYEVEERIESEAVPAEAIQWIGAIEKELPWRWFIERGEGSFSYEAKAGWNGYYFSAEFDSTGAFQDLELQIKWKSLPVGIRSNIAKQWNQRFNRWKIDKVQLQLHQWPRSCWWKERDAPYFWHALYEIEVSSREDRAWRHWVLLHRPDGSIVEQFEIVAPPTLLIDY